MLTSGVVMAAGGLTSNPKYVFFGQETSIQVASPFGVSWGAANMYVSGTDITVWPGQKLASAPVTIENRSPYRYTAQFSASPIRGDWPGLQINILTKASPTYGTTINVEAGQTIEATIEIYIAISAQPVKFQGLQLDISPGPPIEGEKG